MVKYGMKPITFFKESYQVTFPTSALNKVYEMTRAAERLNIEINAKLPVKDSVVQRVEYPALDKIVVIDTRLPFEIKANIRTYYDKIGESICTLREQSYELPTGDIAVELARRNLLELRHLLKKYDASLRYEKNGEERRIEPESAEAILFDDDALVELVEDLRDREAYGAEWWSSKILRPFRIVSQAIVYDKPEEVEDSDETIEIHNHPVNFPSPPSIWVRGSQLSGDVSTIIKGGTYGNLLYRGKDRWELVLFREKDDSNVGAYIDLFNDFWGWIRNREEVAHDIRKLALSPRPGR